MISFEKKGRLGNTLFQLATAIVYSYTTGHELLLPPGTEKISDYISSRYKTGSFSGNVQWHKEPADQSYAPIPYIDPAERVMLDGYFQSEKYFAEYRNWILTELGKSIGPSNNAVSIHLRRGDYTHEASGFVVQPPEYYLNAIKHFTEQGWSTFHIYTEDMGWFIENVAEKCMDIAVFNRQAVGDPLSDMLKASQCLHNIGSNSSFSWWIAWLNTYEHKQCIFPKDWYTGPFAHLSTKDLLPENWITL